jgi:phosphoheptose isomerase
VIALTADTSILTAWSNDVGYDEVFARQVEALGRPGDVLIGLSTSGRSRNVVRAFEAARALGVRTVALLGGDGGAMAPLADVAVTVPSADTQHIQEVHLVVVHVLCELIETRLLAAVPAPARTIWDQHATPRAVRPRAA